VIEDEEEREHFIQLRKLYRKNLRILEEQVAQHGINVPSSVVLQVRECRSQISRINQLLGQSRTVAASTDSGEGRIKQDRKLHTPPETAEYLLWYLPKEIRQPVIGDLAEEFDIVYKQFGERRAVVWYYSQTFTSFWPVIERTMIRWFGTVVRRIIS
jgi:hypothetical protein